MRTVVLAKLPSPPGPRACLCTVGLTGRPATVRLPWPWKASSCLSWGCQPVHALSVPDEVVRVQARLAALPQAARPPPSPRSSPLGGQPALQPALPPWSPHTPGRGLPNPRLARTGGVARRLWQTLVQGLQQTLLQGPRQTLVLGLLGCRTGARLRCTPG